MFHHGPANGNLHAAGMPGWICGVERNQLEYRLSLLVNALVAILLEVPLTPIVVCNNKVFCDRVNVWIDHDKVAFAKFRLHRATANAHGKGVYRGIQICKDAVLPLALGTRRDHSERTGLNEVQHRDPARALGRRLDT